jgi:hypothetical protein
MALCFDLFLCNQDSFWRPKSEVSRGQQIMLNVCSTSRQVVYSLDIRSHKQ